MQVLVRWKRWVSAVVVAHVCLVLRAGEVSPLWAQDTIQPSSPPPVIDARPYTLRFQFVQNQVVNYHVLHETEITTQYNEATEVARNKSASLKHFKVTAVYPDGSADLEMGIDWVHMTASVGENSLPTEIRSDDPHDQPARYKPLLQTIGKTQAVIRFNPLGQMVKFVSTNNPNGQQKPATDAAGNALESYLTPLPEQPVTIGETWKERFDLNALSEDKLPVRIPMLRTYRLTSVTKGQAVIDFRTSILAPNLDPAVRAQLIQRETTGRILFDLEQGRIVSRSSSVDGKVINPFGGKSSMHGISKFQERYMSDEELTKFHAQLAAEKAARTARREAEKQRN